MIVFREFVSEAYCTVIVTAAALVLRLGDVPVAKGVGAVPLAYGNLVWLLSVYATLEVTVCCEVLARVRVSVWREAGHGTSGPAPAGGWQSEEYEVVGWASVGDADVGKYSVANSWETTAVEDVASVAPDRRLSNIPSTSFIHCSTAIINLSISDGRSVRPFCISWISSITAFPSVNVDGLGGVVELGVTKPEVLSIAVSTCRPWCRCIRWPWICLETAV